MISKVHEGSLSQKSVAERDGHAAQLRNSSDITYPMRILHHEKSLGRESFLRRMMMRILRSCSSMCIQKSQRGTGVLFAVRRETTPV